MRITDEIDSIITALQRRFDYDYGVGMAGFCVEDGNDGHLLVTNRRKGYDYEVTVEIRRGGYACKLAKFEEGELYRILAMVSDDPQEVVDWVIKTIAPSAKTIDINESRRPRGGRCLNERKTYSVFADIGRGRMVEYRYRGTEEDVRQFAESLDKHTYKGYQIIDRHGRMLKEFYFEDPEDARWELNQGEYECCYCGREVTGAEGYCRNDDGEICCIDCYEERFGKNESHKQRGRTLKESSDAYFDWNRGKFNMENLIGYIKGKTGVDFDLAEEEEDDDEVVSWIYDAELDDGSGLTLIRNKDKSENSLEFEGEDDFFKINFKKDSQEKCNKILNKILDSIRNNGVEDEEE